MRGALVEVGVTGALVAKAGGVNDGALVASGVGEVSGALVVGVVGVNEVEESI